MIAAKRYVRELEQLKKRILPLTILVTFLFLVLVSRLWYLQVLQADKYRAMSENNRLRFLPVTASRGTLLDRNGQILVSNRPSFSLTIIPQEVKEPESVLELLAQLLELDYDELHERWTKSRGRARYYPVVIASNISQDQVEIVEENRLRLTGVEIGVKPTREYSFNNMAAHLLGHIGEISYKELEQPEYEAYHPGDFIGKNGIEKTWEHELHGSDGGRQLEVDAGGRVLRVLQETSPIVGNSLMLTIDSRLQQAAELAFGDQAGAAVVLDVNTGEVLSLVSNPSFDPALFAGRIPVDIWQGYLEDRRRPLENKALTGQYPPGSTFKMITALAGLEAGIIDEHTTVYCNGAYELGNNKFRCWNRSGHGSVNLKRSLKESCDVYYYQLGEKLGVDRIAAMAERFGLGQATGIGLHEKKGLVPTKDWKFKRYGKQWFRGETLPVSIGQGYLLTTPVQLASMTATIATDGIIHRPHLVKKIVDPDGRTVQEFSPEQIGNTGVSASNFKKIKQGMFSVVNDPGGTGGNARLWDQKVAGKTGTSQVIKLGADRRKALAYHHRDHGLFVAFAPYDKPEIALAVVVEHGGGGGAVAAPIASKILRKYFDLQKFPPPSPSSPGPEREATESLPEPSELQTTVITGDTEDKPTPVEKEPAE